jgi:hypothetical protein
MQKLQDRNTYTETHQLTDDSIGLVGLFHTSNTLYVAVTK